MKSHLAYSIEECQDALQNKTVTENARGNKRVRSDRSYSLATARGAIKLCRRGCAFAQSLFQTLNLRSVIVSMSSIDLQPVFS